MTIHLDLMPDGSTLILLLILAMIVVDKRRRSRGHDERTSHDA